MELSGYTLEELEGKRPGSVLQQVAPSKQVREQMRNGIKRKRGFHVEIVNHTKDGTPYWIEIRCSATFDSEGNHTGFIAIENDVTERHKTSRALEDSLGRLSLATQMAQMGIWSYESTTDKLDWNEENYALHGIPETTESVYELWKSRVAPEDHEYMRNVLRAAEINQSEPVQFEYRYDHPTLGERIVSSRVRVAQGSNTDTRRYTGVNLDITEMRQASERLARAAAKTAAILDNALDSIITIDKSGLIISYNRAAELMFGHTAEDAIGQNVSILMGPDHAGSHTDHINAYMAGRKPVMIGRVTEMEAKRSNGETFPIELAVSKSQDDSGEIFIGVIRDLTERHRADQMKSEFLAVVSHELRTPLTSIHGTLSLINGGVFGDLGPKAQKLLKSALDNSEMLSQMINEILDMEKMTAGKLEVNISDAGLPALLDRVIGATKPYGEKFSVELELEEPVPSVDIQIDENRAVQVISNLISNAVKFSPTGGKVRVETEQKSETIRISVIDRGIGIPKDKQDLLFKKFQQIDASDSRKHGGTGLGLAISRELTESMGGQIGFTSVEGEGSTFWVEFRLSQAEVAEQTARAV